MSPDTFYFSSASEFRAWLSTHHDTVTEAWLGFYNKDSGKTGIGVKEAIDEALCFGWIDGLIGKNRAGSHKRRFTPRKPKSIWSNVNTKRMKELIDRKKVHPAGLAAYARRDAKRAGIYSAENKDKKLAPVFLKQLKANTKAWAFFSKQSPGYQHAAGFWVMAATQEATRIKRLKTLIDDSAHGRTVRPLTRKKDR